MSYLYVETAFHHEGDIDYLKELVIAGKEAGADGIKFQVLTNIDDFLSTKHSAYNSLKDYCFSLSHWREVFTLATQNGLDIILMPLNEEALALIEEFPVKYIDIHSVSFSDDILLEAIKETGTPIILGVGGRSIDEIIEKSLFFGEQLKILMVGFQSFPSRLEDIKLGKITKLKELFPSLEIGYADHSAFDDPFAISSNEYARLLGATIFEKHIAIEEGVERVDFQSAVSVEKIKEIVRCLKYINQNILVDTSTSFTFTQSELSYRNRQKQIVAKEEVKVGTLLTEEMLTTKMIDKQLGFTNIYEVVGKTAVVNIDKDDIISKNSLK
ncbi:N-acetylneuraminate synthase family protein [Pontibacter amylolyticus]|uniref:N-acetylneuraminate synthase n=1 Tax=Pontibacter amylolyticus TaxID=1424080 RepID=A0ABQ1WCW4_9BACT|nr:N-acetylneuraminate synthase family protein [Pontibacter amylolyticus]GGG25280.1 N-acetylneuraminate synthase [Pontibacter amylolyticus]